MDQIKGVDQRLDVDIELGTSFKDILAGEDSLLSQANAGFKAKVSLEVLSNFQTLIFSILKDPDLMNALGPFAMAVSPILFLQMNAKIDLDFDSFEEMKELPMLEPFMANFSQLFEGMFGSDVETMLSDRIEI